MVEKSPWRKGIPSFKDLNRYKGLLTKTINFVDVRKKFAANYE